VAISPCSRRCARAALAIVINTVGAPSKWVTPSWSKSQIKRELYLAGLRSAPPPVTTDAGALEDSARQRLDAGPSW